MNEQVVQELLDREAIREVRARLAQALDYKDWALFESFFTEEVEVDFSSYGVPVQKVRREDLTGSYRQNLSREGIRTQHLFTNFRITIDGDRAECISNFLGQHFLQGFEGGDEFHLRGEYHDQLTRTQAGWKIHALKFVFFFATGNPALIAQ